MLIRKKGVSDIKRKERKALNDNRIVELYLSRDETAIKQISDQFGTRLYSLAYGIVNDHQTAGE